MIYVHVPFCRSFCTYCGFYSESVVGCSKRMGEDRLFSSYADEICSEAESRRSEILASADKSSGCVNTLYIGGGTPSVLPPDHLRRIVSAVSEGLPVFDEFTLEANPEDIVEGGFPLLEAWREMGVTRLSMGVQSFDDDILHWMNRRHSAVGAEKAFNMARESGFDNISIDLIFGLSQLDTRLWQSTLQKAISLAPEHISAYQLSIEEGSAAEKLISRGKYREADEDACREQYQTLCSLLASAGYHHYEISNFARPGYEAVHNSAYWQRVPYVGLGPGAHSFPGGTVRRWNTQEISGYRSEGEYLTDSDVLAEEIMLALRTDCGMDASKLSSLTDPSTLSMLMAAGSLVRCGDRIRIPEDKFFVSDDIVSDLI